MSQLHRVHSTGLRYLPGILGLTRLVLLEWFVYCLFLLPHTHTWPAGPPRPADVGWGPPVARNVTTGADMAPPVTHT